MRAPFLAGSLGWLVIMIPAAIGACSSGSATTEVPQDPEAGTSTPAPGTGGEGGAPKGDAGTDAPSAPKNDCKLDALTGVADVTATFVTYSSPSQVPPAMTGGTLKGKYKVDKAKVYLPSGTAGLADPKKSSGSVNAWAVFDGTNYRIKLEAAFTIESVIGPQTQGTDTASQGGFAVSSAALTLDHACDTALADEADYSFTDNGTGRATLLIKTPSSYGDTYLELEAAKE